MALCFDKFTDMVGGGGRGAGRDQIDAPILPAAYFALWAQRRMHDRGTTPEHFATIAAKNWNYGAKCPTAHRQSDHVVTAEEVLAARMVAEPLTTNDVLPTRRRRRLHHRGPRGPRPAAPAGPPPGARPGLGPHVGDLLAGPHLRRSGGRPRHHDA